MRRIFVLILGLSLPVQAATIAGVGQQRYPLGSGFDADSSQLLNERCVEAGFKQLNDRRATFHTDYAKDFESMNKSIDRLASGGFDVGLFGASASVEYFARIAQSKLRESLLLEFHAQDGSLVLGPKVVARSDLSLKNKADLDKRALCGTDFVQQIDLGYRLFLNITLNFNNYDTYERYKKTVKVSALFGLISHTSTSIDELKKFGKELQIEVNAMQEGGDDAFIKTQVSGDHQCGADEIEQCLGIFNAILRYMNAPADVPVSFQKTMQAASQRSYLDPKGPAILRYVTAPYEDAGILDLAHNHSHTLPDTQEIVRAKANLNRALVYRLSLQQRVLSAIDGGFVGNPDFLQAMLAGVNGDIDRLEEALMICAAPTTRTQCKTNGEGVIRALSTVDESRLYPQVAIQ